MHLQPEIKQGLKYFSMSSVRFPIWADMNVCIWSGVDPDPHGSAWIWDLDLLGPDPPWILNLKRIRIRLWLWFEFIQLSLSCGSGSSCPKCSGSSIMLLKIEFSCFAKKSINCKKISFLKIFWEILTPGSVFVLLLYYRFGYRTYPPVAYNL